MMRLRAMDLWRLMKSALHSVRRPDFLMRARQIRKSARGDKFIARYCVFSQRIDHAQGEVPEAADMFPALGPNKLLRHSSYRLQGTKTAWWYIIQTSGIYSAAVVGRAKPMIRTCFEGRVKRARTIDQLRAVVHNSFYCTLLLEMPDSHSGQTTVDLQPLD